MEETLDQISPILPIDFFRVTLDLVPYGGALKKKHLLPHFEDLLYEVPFAVVKMGWDRKGLYFEFDVHKKVDECFFPNVRRGDSVELFIDTRDLKSASFNTRFCHHFVFLPKEVDGVMAEEVTRFRTDDKHELCAAEKLVVRLDYERKSYTMKILIPSECLEGYDPASFDRLGFAYRINRPHADPQHLTLSSDYIAIESEPSLWTSMEMQ